MKPYKKKYGSYYNSILDLQNRGIEPIYKSNSLYPAIEIEVITVEKSRDEMGALESTILKLIQFGIGKIESIARLTGFAHGKKLTSLLGELEGYNYIKSSQDGYDITELGKLSLQNGYQMLETKAVLLLCGRTGKLLPKKMYDAKKTTEKDLPASLWQKFLFEERERILMKELQLIGIDKRKHNIKDEVMYIASYDYYEPVFIEADITLFSHFGNIGSIVTIANEELDWLTYSDIEALIDPADKMNEKIDTLNDFFKSGKFENIRITELEHSSIAIEFDAAPEWMLSERFEGMPFIAYVGSKSPNAQNTVKPIPLNRLPYIKQINKEIYNKLQLNGRLFYLITSSDVILKYTNIFRSLYATIGEYKKINYKDRAMSQDEYFRNKVGKMGFNTRDIEYVINKFGSEAMKSAFVGENLHEQQNG